MPRLDVKAVGDLLIAAVKGHVGVAVEAISKRIDAETAKLNERCENLAKTILSIPAGPKGDPGERGLPGESIQGPPGIAGKDGVSVSRGDLEVFIHSAILSQVDDLPEPLPGKDGAPGKDADSIKIYSDLCIELNRLFAALPAPVPGPQGVPGPAGKDGESISLASMRAVIAQEVEDAMPDPVKGDPGIPGERGIDADEEAIYERVVARIPAPVAGPVGPKGEDADEQKIYKELCKQLRAELMQEIGVQVTSLSASIAGPPGERGPAGENADESRILNALSLQLTAEVTERFKALPKPIDGAPGKDAPAISEDTLFRLVSEQVRQHLPSFISEAKDGRDALALEVLPALDPTKSYPRNTYAEHRGGIVRAHRETDPLSSAGEGEALETLGWATCMNGVFAEDEEYLDSGRVIRKTTEYTSGKVVVQERTTAWMIYREVWKEQEYQQGDIVTYGGSSWHCQSAATANNKPGYSDTWKLMVKEGRRGKDGAAPSQQRVAVPVRIKGE